MASKTFCPIMTIGFNPPEEGKRDLRLCKKDCTWYDVSENRCQISIIADNLQALETHTSDISDYIGDMMLYNQGVWDYEDPGTD